MPIIVKKFTWKQSNEKIYITIPLNGVHSSKIFLYDKINETDVEIIFNDSEALLELPKAEQKMWTSLEIDYSKKEKINMKELAIEYVQNKTKTLIEEKQQKKADLNKLAIKMSMEMDTEENKKIKDLRKAEQIKAMNNFENWRIKSETPSDPKINPYHKNIKKTTSNIKSKNTISDKTIIIPTPITQHPDIIEDQPKTIPALRESGTIMVKFTERIFPTPIRESQSNTEEIWLKKFNAARRESGFVSEDLRPEERNPQWCKEKGDEFLKKGNYKGALNAYSHGIKLSDKLPTLYSNRAVAHFTVGNYNKCIEDCSTALDLFVPECGANLNMRIKCIVRRAAALTRIGMLNKAINEMKCAIKMQPNDEKLKNDLYNMERAWEQDPDSD